MKVYLIFASTGEGEDYSTQVVHVASTKAKAKAFAVSQEKILKYYGLHAYAGVKEFWFSEEGQKNKKIAEKELGISIDWTGAWYNISEPFEVDKP